MRRLAELGDVARRVAASGVIVWCVRWRVAILLGLSAAAGSVEAAVSGSLGDASYFEHSGRLMLGNGGLHVYGDPALQSGPLQLAIMGGFAELCSLVHLPANLGFALVTTAASTLLVVRGVRLLRRRLGVAEAPYVELLVGLAGLGWLVSTEVYTSGHVAELAVPLLWALAAGYAEDGRYLIAGSLVGLSAGFETWGVLGVVVVLLARGFHARLASAATVVGIGLAWYLPFVIAGPFRMGAVVWPVTAHSVWHTFDPGMHALPWFGRFLQAVVVVGAGSGCVWAASRRAGLRTHSIWLVPALVGLTKAATEPAGFDWYWLPAQVCLLLGVACWDDLPGRLRAASGLSLAVVVTPLLQQWPFGLAVVGLLIWAAGTCHESSPAVPLPRPAGTSPNDHEERAATHRRVFARSS